MKLKYKLALLSVTFGAAGCNSNNCGDCGKQEREPKRVDTVYVKYVDGDCVHIENGCGTVIYNKNGEVVYTEGNGNNSSSRNSGTENWERGQRPYQKKVVKKVEEKREEEKKPEEKKPEELKTYTGTLVIDVYHEKNCNSY